ncbi:MAG: hypothetical protein KJZ80_19235 [Hyphomicrobiaceae bacterium]|nr:hypothetical protein [Hyphomicrobiaceae bacterium]
MLLLKGRHKDGLARERGVSRVTHSAEEFDCTLRELADMAQLVSRFMPRPQTSTARRSAV